jgi:hypothetical protein
VRLHRPYIPLAVRVQVAERQLGLKSVSRRRGSLSVILKGCLVALFGGRAAQLDHDPALVNRRRFYSKHGMFYRPDANDPDYLVYREKHDHEIKTRVRGDGAQLSDLAQVRKRKRKLKVKRKYKWPSRPMKGASRWQKKST